MASIFAVQRELEDYLERLRLEDRDQYAVRLSNLYDRERHSLDSSAFLGRMKKISTVFFKMNRDLERSVFERELLERLDQRFLKKNPSEFPGGVEVERREVLKSHRRFTIRRLLTLFKSAVEARGIGSYWLSRVRGELRSRPEIIAQDQLALFAQALLKERGGLVLREFASGIGYVDVGIILSKVLHLVEIKIWKDGSLDGVEQLATYMGTEGRREGWLVVVDSRSSPEHDGELDFEIALDEGIVRLVYIRINPVPPSKKRQG